MDLMTPRLRVKADYPFSPYKPGDLITFDEPDTTRALIKIPVRDEVGENVLHDYRFPIEDFLKYPAAFSIVEWWEDRQESEMPEYVIYAETGEVYKVHHFDLETTSAWFMWLGEEVGVGPYSPGGSALEGTHFLPATEAEYLAYKDQQKGGSDE